VRLVFAVLALLALAVSGTAAIPASAAASLPCDIYGADGAPCVAAHSTVRALYGAYSGRLYQVRRASDGATAQDSFCASTRCTITVIYDQSPRHNDLTIEGAGGAGGQDVGASADALPVSAGGHPVYGVSISPGMGYRDDATSGVAVNGQPESMYMVASGTHVNGSCCFDYGNAETNNRDNGNGHMDALYFGTGCYASPCNGVGPWAEADLENGLFQSADGGNQDTGYTGTTAPYATALLKNNGQDHFALKDGDARSGGLTTHYSGPLPTSRTGYSPLHQEGAIVLGTGGDNSNSAVGSFFEGVMTAGVPSDAADNAVQANIVSVGYGGANGVPGGTLTPGSAVSLRATTACCTDRYIRHQNGGAITSVITSASPALDKADATWIVRRGLADNTCVSFESENYPGDFLRHSNYRIYRQSDDGGQLFADDATFCPEAGKSGQGTSFRSHNYPDHYIRHYNATVYIASDGGPNAWDTATLWPDDVTWAVGQPWA
jgi:hypothetical protein